MPAKPRSSLSYLRRFPLDCLKIGRSFSLRCCSDAGDAAIVEAIIGLAHTLYMEVLAEGVETSEQLDFMITRRCDLIQGYLFSRPLLAEQFTARLAMGNRLALPVPTLAC